MSFLAALFPPSLTAAEASETDAVVLDVRERSEWKAGHAPGSTNIPLSTLGARTHELQPGRRYVAVCRTGARSRRAVAQLRRAGFDVVNLKGGMHAWARAGLPLEPRGGRVA
jgi:rhodanese-related sulfurtransferase